MFKIVKYPIGFFFLSIILKGIKFLKIKIIIFLSLKKKFNKFFSYLASFKISKSLSAKSCCSRGLSLILSG